MEVVATTAAIRRTLTSSQIVTINKPTPSFLQARCPSCCPTNSVRAPVGKASRSELSAKYLFVCVVLKDGSLAVDGNVAWTGRHTRHSYVFQLHLTRVSRVLNLRRDLALITNINKQ